MELRSRRKLRMRSPVEGPRTEAGPGTGVRASSQRLEGEVQERVTSRVQPEELPPHGNSSHRHHPRNAAPTRRVATARRQSSTLVGTTRCRIMWTHEMNEYYICTALETDMSGRPRILTMFEEVYPEFVGRLDQNAMNARRSTVVRNNMLSQTQVDEIKQQVQRELSCRTNRASDVSRRSSVRLSNSFASGARESAPVEATVQQPPEPEDLQPDQQLLRDLVFHYDEAIPQFRDTDPLSRPSIPKLQHSRRLTSAVKLMNENVLPLHLVDAENMEELQLKVYCAAVATAKCLGYRIRPRGGLLQHLRERREPPWRRRLEQRILNKRAAIGRLMAYKRGSRSAKLCRQVAVIVRPTELRQLGAHQLTKKLYTLVQQLSVLTKRLKRYERRSTTTLATRSPTTAKVCQILAM
ncbi:uncharacterized protein LOC129771418 [Toxorhynchites rutilus septentrionalis]|uniref:uncharacterized protein LOC129771418 n=1 Tax=Toxorhynchites rutilus septentrionalis TaxID=329112 RepID=UPI00247B2921|nr:uncharacterized protein LOC129771418 [Toxorhynchites rutilus septentrionalis]